MSKKIYPEYVREVIITDEHCDNGASHLYVQISPKLYDYIKKCQRIVKNLKASRICKCDYTPDYMNLKDGEHKGPDDYTYEDLTTNDEMSLDTNDLCVTDTGIYWSGTLSNTPYEVYCDEIAIQEIDDNFKMLSLPIEELPTYINHCDYKSSQQIVYRRLSIGGTNMKGNTNE